MTRRPWRVEFMGPEGLWVIASTFSTEDRAEAGKAKEEADNPGVTYRVEKHVEFEASK